VLFLAHEVPQRRRYRSAISECLRRGLKGIDEAHVLNGVSTMTSMISTEGKGHDQHEGG
jgi:hypothetical protein